MFLPEPNSSDMHFHRRRWQRWIKVFVVALLALGVTEIYLRIKCYDPHAIFATEPVGEIYRFTKDHGHEPKPGCGYVDSDEKAISEERTWPNGRRSSRPLPIFKKPKYKVALFGCSWTYGTGVTDYNTYAWQLNERYPNIEFDNFGVPDYGAYLTRLRLQSVIAAGAQYDLYIYAFIYDHLFRDLMDSVYIPEGHYGLYWIPGYKLGHPLELTYLHTSVLPGESFLALPRYIHKWFHDYYLRKSVQARNTKWENLDDNRQSFRENVLAMRDLVKEVGAKFAVIALSIDSDKVYQATLTDSGIEKEAALNDKTTYCNLTNYNGMGHPNKLGHREIAQAVTRLLQRQHLPSDIMEERKDSANSEARY